MRNQAPASEGSAWSSVKSSSSMSHRVALSTTSFVLQYHSRCTLHVLSVGLGAWIATSWKPKRLGESGWFVVVTVGWAILCECSLIMQSGREAQSADFKTRTSTGAIAPASLSGLQLDFVCKALRIRTSIAKLAHLALIESTGDESEAALSSLVCKDDGCLAPSPTLSTGSVRLSRSPVCLRLPLPHCSPQDLLGLGGRLVEEALRPVLDSPYSLGCTCRTPSHRARSSRRRESVPCGPVRRQVSRQCGVGVGRRCARCASPRSAVCRHGRRRAGSRRGVAEGRVQMEFRLFKQDHRPGGVIRHSTITGSSWLTPTPT